MKPILAVLLAACYSASIAGQEITLVQTKASGIYKQGEIITIIARTGSIKGDSVRLKVIRNSKVELLKKSIRVESDSIVLFSGAFDEPCSVMAEIADGDKYAALGAMVAPLRLKPGRKAPSDFRKYWDMEKKALRELPMEVKQKNVQLPDSVKAYTCSDIEINCTSPRPARGYYAKPLNAGRHSCPAVLLVHAAGVKGSWCRSEPENALRYAERGAICLDLNAHGMLNGQPDEYYDSLEKGDLRMYSFQGLTNRNECYFRGICLRLLRAIDYLAQQPEWDGKSLLVIGESQGGGQALEAAGLDRRVSAAVAIVPAMCDWMGPEAGREGGWPQPMKAEVPKSKIAQAIPYFDAANLLKNSRARLFVEVGLIDVACPPASVYAAFNQARGKNIIIAVPYRPHHQPQGSLARSWEEAAFKPREQFIENFLKAGK